MTARLLDALRRAYEPAQCEAVHEILLAGAEGSVPLVDPLAELFSGAVLTLVDRDEAALNRVCNPASAERLRPVRSGLVDLPDLASGPYNLILIRHPDIVQARAAWEAGLRACQAVLARRGVLVTSTRELADAAFINEKLAALGLVLRDGSPYTLEPVAFDGSDRYILIHEAAQAFN